MSVPISSQTAQLYDISVPDWPGELDFYHRLVAEMGPGGAVLEVACGTGRVALRLAQAGTRVVGVDRSAAMLAVARAKSAGVATVRWEEGDMRTFDLGEQFALVIMPGHSFQHMLAPDDQLATLATVKRHLAPSGRLVVHLDHQDIEWLGDLTRELGGRFEVTGTVTHPETGQPIRVSQAWQYERATQTASVVTRREVLGEAGQVVDPWETGPVHLHCLFRFEMDHLLARAGYGVEALYGDFFGQPLTDESADMIWLARAL